MAVNTPTRLKNYCVKNGMLEKIIYIYFNIAKFVIFYLIPFKIPTQDLHKDPEILLLLLFVVFE